MPSPNSTSSLSPSHPFRPGCASPCKACSSFSNLQLGTRRVQTLSPCQHPKVPLSSQPSEHCMWTRLCPSCSTQMSWSPAHLGSPAPGSTCVTEYPTHPVRGWPRSCSRSSSGHPPLSCRGPGTCPCSVPCPQPMYSEPTLNQHLGKEEGEGNKTRTSE